MSEFTDRLERIEALVQDGTLSYDALPMARIKSYLEENLLLDPDVNLEGLVGANRVARVPVVTALPALADIDDGQEIAFIADATNGVVWKFKYRAASASAFKWEFIGGSPLYTETLTAATVPVTGVGVYVDIGGGVPIITMPTAFDGDYMIHHGATLSETNVTADIVSVAINKDGSIVAGSGISDLSTTSGSSEGGTYSRHIRIAGVTTSVKQQYNSVNGVTGVQDRYIVATPVRVG